MVELGDIKFVVEHHQDGYVAYPLGVEGVVVGEGETAEVALENARSALRFHIETFGYEVLSCPTTLKCICHRIGRVSNPRGFLVMLPKQM